MKAKISIHVIEVIFYVVIGGIIGAIVGGIRPATIGLVPGMGMGAAAAVGWYLVYLFDKLMWSTHSFIYRLIGSSIPFLGFGLVIMLVGDGIRYAAFQFYSGENPVEYAFFGEKTQWAPALEATVIDKPLCSICPVKQAKVEALQFLAEGNVLAAGFEDRLDLYATETGRKVLDLGEAYAISRDKSRAAYVEKGGTLCMYDIASGKTLWSQATNDNPIKCIAFSADDRRAATGSKDGMVRVWDAGNGSLLAEFPHKGGAVLSVDLSPDGKLLACGSIGGKVYVWDIDGKKLGWTLPQKPPSYWDPVRVTRVEFSRDGRFLVSVSAYQKNNSVHLWRMSDGKELLGLSGVAFLGRMMVLSDLEVMLVYDLQSYRMGLYKLADGKTYKNLPEKYHSLPVSISAGDGFVRLGTIDGRVVSWNVAANSFTEFRASATMSVNAVGYTPGLPLYVTGGNDQMVRVWKADSGELVVSFAGHEKPIRCTAISQKGDRVASASVDNEIRVWKVEE